MAEILVIDDTPSRWAWFQDVLEPMGHDVRLANDADVALDQFRETDFDVAFFDHDLGEGLNGSKLANHILYNPKTFKLPQSVWIHSNNPVGAKNIEAKFKSAGIPYRMESFDSFYLRKDYFQKAVTALLETLPEADQ